MSRRPPASVPIDVLRGAIREAIGTRSLREVAAEIGISHTGLRGFLHGARPHRHTRLKLEQWLSSARLGEIREPAGSYAAPAGRDTFLLGLTAVRALASPNDAERATHEYTALVRRLFTDAGREPPAWLDEDREQ